MRRVVDLGPRRQSWVRAPRIARRISASFAGARCRGAALDAVGRAVVAHPPLVAAAVAAGLALVDHRAIRARRGESRWRRQAKFRWQRRHPPGRGG
jgi:hypothetical protein